MAGKPACDYSEKKRTEFICQNRKSVSYMKQQKGTSEILQQKT
jgi:hypothetical protein